MPGLHLCTFPAEVRGLIISEGMQEVVTVIENIYDERRFAVHEGNSIPNARGLLGTCRLLREETFAYLGANVPLFMPTTLYVIRNPFAALPLAYKLKIQHIKVDLGHQRDLLWTFESLPSLKTLHVYYEDYTMNRKLCTMFRDGDLTLADIVNHSKLECLRASVDRAHLCQLDLITRDTKERSWTFSLTITCGQFVAEVAPLSSDAEDEADEPFQIEETQEHENHVVKDDGSEVPEDAETDEDNDSSHAEVLGGPVLVCTLLLFQG